MRLATLIVCFALVPGADVLAASPAHVRSAPRGSRASYGSNYGNHYQYLGLGYGYARGTPGAGWGAGFGGGRYGRRGGYGGSGGYGGYGGYGRGGDPLEMQHEQQMMWSLQFAPMPQTVPDVTINPYFNPYQSHLDDDIYHVQRPAPIPETLENPYVKHRSPSEAR